MTVVDVLAAISEGSLPSNEQLLRFLDVLEKHDALRVRESQQQQKPNKQQTQKQTGSLLRRDAQEVLHSLRGLILNRNGGEEVQEVIWSARGGVLKLEEMVSKEEVEKRKAAKKEAKSKSKANGTASSTGGSVNVDVKATARKTATHLFTLVRTILIQPQLRHLISDVVFLVMQVGDETFVQTRLQSKIPRPDNPNQTLTVQDLEAIKDNLTNVISELQRGNVNALAPALQKQPNGQSAVSSAADTLQLLTVDGLLARATALKADVLPELANTTTANAKRIWKDEGQQRVLQRIRQLLVDVQKTPSTQQSLLWAVGNIERAGLYFVETSKQVSDRVEGGVTTASVVPHIVSLLENFLGNGNVREMLRLTRRLSIGFHEDEALHKLVTSTRTFVYRCVQEEGWALTTECETEFYTLLDGFKSLRSEWQSDLRRLLTLVGAGLTSLRTDPILLSIVKSFKKLVSDLTLGQSFLFLPSKASLHEIFHSILPSIFTKSVLPIPRIKYTHPDFVLVLENIAISLRDLIPDVFEFKVQNDFHVDFQRVKRKKRKTSKRNTTGDDKTFEHAHSFKIKIKGLGLRVHKVAFAVDLLKGIKLHDKGILDLNIQDVGASIYIDIPRDASSKVETSHCFRVRRVRTRLGKLSVKVRQSNHAILHKLAEGLVDGAVTKFILRKLMAKGITLGLQQLDVALMQLKLNNWMFTSPDDEALSRREQMVRLKKQAAELRDMMVKMRQQAGTLEVDFVDPESGQGAVELWKKENLKIWAWIQRQFVSTGSKDVKRGDTWKSSVFDVTSHEGEGQQGTQQASSKTPNGTANPAATAQTLAEETQKEAQKAGKPQGPTTQDTVDDAEKQARKQKRKYWSWFSRKERRQ